MSVMQAHIEFYREIFNISGFFQEPVLMFGFQDMFMQSEKPDAPLGRPAVAARIAALLSGPNRVARIRRKVTGFFSHHRIPDVPKSFQCHNLQEMLLARGVRQLVILDLFDSRADIRHDMNYPVSPVEHGKYGTLIDIGCLEHVFDTKQCLENCLGMVRTGGFYFLVTVVKGYFGHGFHVFNPTAILDALRLNGFSVVYERYSTQEGKPIREPSIRENVLMWVVGRRTQPAERFVVPQQGTWSGFYAGRSEGA
jgi:hypothetical protein